MDYPISSALGNALADATFLAYAHVPDGLTKDDARAIVIAANSINPARPPYAFLVCEDPEEDGSEYCTEVTAKEAIRYRQDRHAAVVFGRQPDLPSFLNTFKEVVGQSFPEVAEGPVSLPRVARIAVRHLLEPLGLRSNDDVPVDIIESCLSELKDLYIDGHSDIRSWNSVWFRHGNAGLRNLAGLLDVAKEEGSSLSVRDLFEQYAHAAFGLPVPARLWRERRSPSTDSKALNDAREEYWSSSETISNTVQVLRIGMRRGADDLARVDWAEFDEAAGAAPNIWLGFAEFLGSNVDWIRAFAKIQEKDFLNPGGEAQTNAILSLLNANGEELSLDVNAIASPALITMSNDPERGDGQYWSEALCVVVPLTAAPASMSIADVRVVVSLTPASQAEWQPEGITRVGDELYVEGRIKWKFGTGKNAARFRQLNLTVTFPSGSVASPHLPLKAQVLNLLTFDSQGEFLAVVPRKAKGAIGRANVLGYWEDQDSNTEPSVELKPAPQGFIALLWKPNGEEVFLDGSALPRHSRLAELASAHLVPTGTHEFVAGQSHYRVSCTETQSGQQSAILAAALKQQVTPKRPSSPTVESVRGQYEAFASESLVKDDDQAFLNALGHYAFPGDMQANMTELRPQDGGAILMSGQARRTLRNHSFVSFDHPEFVYGPSTQRFRDSVRRLGLSNRLGIKGDGDGATFEWASRTSWQDLWDRAELEEYLDSYTEMVESAKKTGKAELVFWASYPFSISVWDVESASGCDAVLLSPLHPIRLAWLAGVEQVLGAASDPLDFVGSIEGWNFPVTGPGSGSGHRMVAIPCDTGEGQMFASWGMLVKASTSDPVPLSPPTSVGSFHAPGTAVSGLNATAVDAALRSFRKMHPQVTTLTVDLSAQKSQNRLGEIDTAVLRMAAKWKESPTEGLLGGIRVLDSVNRVGTPPRDELTSLVRENPDLLFTWSRYNPRKAVDRACNVRFLQDSGSIIRAGEGRNRNGILGRIPLRRFEGNDGLISGNHVNDSSPGIRTSMGWRPFTAALDAIERQGGYPLVSSGISRGSLSDKSANWTVMGETYASPSTIAALMSNESHGEQMLWEWRPPVLEEGIRRALLEKRPFVALARVPRAFGHELTSMLRRVLPDEVADDLRQSVMTTLGRRGVGLSSLLAMGGTHVAGALGFYLALSMFDQTRREGTNRLVVPIDAADYFLRTLADGAVHGAYRRRADLLVMDLSDSGLTMTPVEVKAYGLQSKREDNLLPDPASPALNNALDQLQDSQRLLANIEGLSGALEGADSQLWWNSLATLVEVAAKLSPETLGSVDDFVSRMSKLVDGKLPVKVGQPILTYFLCNARTADGASYYAGTVGAADFSTQGLICDVETAFKAIRHEDTRPLRRAWYELVDSALNYAAHEPSLRPPIDRQDVLLQPTRPLVPNGNLHVAPGEAAVESGGELPHRAPHADPENPTGVPTGEDPPSFEAAFSAGSHAPISPQSVPERGISDQGVRVNIGTVLESIGNAHVDFWPSNTDLNQPNIGIVGDLGTGKTELVKALIAQIREQARLVQPGVPTSMLIFDYKGDFQQEEFLGRVGGVVLEPHKIPLNIFLPVTEEYSRKPYQQGAALADTFKRIYSGIGPRQMSLLNQAVRDSFLSKNDSPPTLAEVRDRYVGIVSDPDSVTSILDTFVFGEIFSADQDELRSFDDLLEGNVVVVALNKLGQDSNTKNSLVALFLNLYHDYMLRGGILPFEGTDPILRYLRSFLLVDEAVNIMRYDFQVLEDIMLKGRGAGIGVILASQYLSHFRVGRTNYGQPLRTWFIHKVPSVSAKELAALGITGVSEEVAQRVPTLGNHQVLYKSFGWDEGWFVRATPYYELYG